MQTALAAVYKLIQKSDIMGEGREKLIFNPEYQVKSESEGFRITSKDKQLFLEFKDEAERLYFTELVQHDVFVDSIPTDNLNILINTLIEEQLVFCLPV